MDEIDDIGKAVARIRPLLAGKATAVQGAILTELVAKWLAGCRQEVRGPLLAAHGKAVRNTIELLNKLEKEPVQ
jgi:hypothetical protein